jgi:murein L,D-transpeptidase YafK
MRWQALGQGMISSSEAKQGSGSRVTRARTSTRFALALAVLLGGREIALAGKADAPVPAGTLGLMAARNMTASAPILMRAYKKEAELEVWKLARDGRYALLKTFPICRWSGQLGPKHRQGDRQTPEGFYPIAPKQMNPNSAYYLSFDTGFPNAYDKAHGYSGSALMVHGTCSSMGCYAMTDKQVGEIYALARDAFAGGQKAFQFQAFPFRMTAHNIARYRTDPNIAFWRELKEGSDRFEATGEEPVVGVAGGHYVFAPSRDATREALAVQRRNDEEARFASLVADGVAAMRVTYSDGGQHPSFAALLRAGAYLGDVSRPEALLLAGHEVTVIPARRKTIQVANVAAANASGAANNLAALPPTALMVASFSLSDAEPSIFTYAPMSYGPGHPGLSAPALSGSARITPAILASANFEIQAAR